MSGQTSHSGGGAGRGRGRGQKRKRIVSVINRRGLREPLRMDKITDRLLDLADKEPRLSVPVELISVKVVQYFASRGGMDGRTTREIDVCAAEQAESLVHEDPDFGLMAGRLRFSNLGKDVPDTFSQLTYRLYHHADEHGRPRPQVSEQYYLTVMEHAAKLDALVVYDRDYFFDHLGYHLLCQKYLRSLDGEIVERPQHMYLRVAVQLWMGYRESEAQGGVGGGGDKSASAQGGGEAGGEGEGVDHYLDLQWVKMTYDAQSQHLYTHATPTLMNCGTPQATLASCFQFAVNDDSVEGIAWAARQIMMLSKGAGGIGLDVTRVRAEGSPIGGTLGRSNGVVALAKFVDATARYIDQGGGKRKGAVALYLQCWHADVPKFIRLRDNVKDDDHTARDIFFGVPTRDLLLQRARRGEPWTLFCPSDVPDLVGVTAAEFELKYLEYERQGLGRVTVDAAELCESIMQQKGISGMPYTLSSDNLDRYNWQRHLGVVDASNLCSETTMYNDAAHVAPCVLASLALPRFVTRDFDYTRPEVSDPGYTGPESVLEHYDFDGLKQMAYLAVVNLNRVVDCSRYNTEEAQRGNDEFRNVGLGVQGLADVFFRLGVAFTSPAAKELNRHIAETIYYGAVSASRDLARRDGPYPRFKGSYCEEGKLNYHLYGQEPVTGWDWRALEEEVQEHGMRNSLLLALMPTATTSAIMRNTECFEPLTAVIGVRKMTAGYMVVANQYCIRALQSLGLWNKAAYRSILTNQSSLREVAGVPEYVKSVFRTAYELPMKPQIDMAADRQYFVDQSQSFNAHVRQGSSKKIFNAIRYASESGLKTCMYYLRQQPAQAVQSTVLRDGEEFEHTSPGLQDAPSLSPPPLLSASSQEAKDPSGGSTYGGMPALRYLRVSARPPVLDAPSSDPEADHAGPDPEHQPVPAVDQATVGGGADAAESKEEQVFPAACLIDNPDCDSCGS